MKLWVRLVGPRDGTADEGEKLESWIVADAKLQGEAEPRAMTGWIELGKQPKTLLSSEQGGRVIVAQRLDDGTSGEVRFEVTGQKIEPGRSEIAISSRANGRNVSALTRYPGSRNILIAAELR